MASLLAQRARERRLVERAQAGPGGPMPGALQPPRPALAQPSIQQPAPGMVREPGGPVEPQQESDYLDRIAGLNPSTKQIGIEATQQAILGAVAANAPEGSPIRMIAQIFQAGHIGRQEARAAAKVAAQKQIMGDALAKGKFQQGAAALLEIGDTEGAKVLFDREDAKRADGFKQAEINLDTQRVEISRNEALSEAQRRDAMTRLDEEKLAIQAAQDAWNRQAEQTRLAIQDRNSRFKVEGGRIVDVVNQTSTPIAGFGGSTAENPLGSDPDKGLRGLNTIQDNLRQDEAFKTAQSVASALEQVRANMQSNSRQADLGLLKGMVKIQEGAGSRISNDDFAIQAGDDLQSIQRRAAQLGITLVEGRLDPVTRREILTAAEGVARGVEKRSRETISTARRQAEALGVDPSLITDPFDPKKGVDTRSAAERLMERAKRLSGGGGE